MPSLLPVPVRPLALLLLALALASPGPLAGVARAQQGGPPPVTVANPVARTVVEWDEYTGQFSPVEYVELRARVSGYLTEIHFTDGQIVKKGDLLFVIDPRPYEIQLANARAQVEQAKAGLELAERQLARAAELRQKDFTPASTYDERVQQVKGGQATLDSANASLRDAELNLEFTHITAPVGGRISTHNVSIGNLIGGGGGSGTPTLLTTIVSLDPIYFLFDMSEADYLSYQRAAAAGKLSGTRDGKVPVEVRLTDETDWHREGRLNFVDNQVDRGSGTIRARADFPNPDLLITPGQFGRIRVPASEPYQALQIPDAAVATDQSTKIVMTVTADGTVQPKPVKLGPLIDGLRVVRAGLTAEDKVIIDGLMRARPGGKVTPEPGKIEPDPKTAN